MEKKYISEARYKKNTNRKRRDNTTVKSNLKSSKNITKNKTKKKSKKLSNTSTYKKKLKKRRKQSKKLNITICIILLVAIAIISRAILKKDNEPFIALPFIESSNDEIIKIGIVTEDSLLDKNTNNMIINELNKYSKDMLLEINEDYSITYKILKDIKKISNNEYVLVKNPKSKVSVSQIKDALLEYSTNEKTIYYDKLKNIEKVKIIDEENIQVELKKQDEYFIYSLDICLASSTDFISYIKDASSKDNELILNRRKAADKKLPLKIVVTKYKDMYAAVEAYKKGEINIFTTDADNVQNILGKYEYNIKTYRNGKNVFLFGNPNSELYSKPEIRKAIAYSINRDKIIQDVLKGKGDKIDLPYIYDNIKYKYDVYAAENLLLTNKYTKTNKVYSKKENGKKLTLELDLIVNKNDNQKINIANNIKNNLSSIGIKINVIKLEQAKIEQRLKKGNYDLLLANVYLNNNPNISFLSQYLYFTDEINEVESKIKLSENTNINGDILALQSKLSEQVSAIGIYSDVSYLVYSKDITGIQNISYMNLFKDIFK